MDGDHQHIHIYLFRLYIGVGHYYILYWPLELIPYMVLIDVRRGWLNVLYT